MNIFREIYSVIPHISCKISQYFIICCTVYEEKAVLQVQRKSCNPTINSDALLMQL